MSSDDKIVVGADPVFALPPVDYSAPSMGYPVTKKSCSTIGVSLRSWRFGVDQSFWEREIARTLDVFGGLYDIRYIFLPFQCGEDEDTSDMPTLERVRGLMDLANRVDIPTKPMCFSALRAAISTCDFVLGMRLHSLVFSATEGVPFLGIVYDDKICRVFDSFQSCSDSTPWFAVRRVVSCAVASVPRESKAKNGIRSFRQPATGRISTGIRGREFVRAQPEL